MHFNHFKKVAGTIGMGMIILLGQKKWQVVIKLDFLYVSCARQWLL